jgi:crotonobetaine/carnitine-CoA ligase
MPLRSGPARTLTDVLAERLRDSPDRPAIADQSTALTYRELYDAACAMAGGLRAAGVQPGDRVLVMMDNHVDNVVLWVATAFAGATHVSINTAYHGELLGDQVGIARPKLICCDAGYAAVLAPWAGDVPIVVGGPAFAELAAGTPIEPHPVRPWDVAEVRFTSGTTGPAKAVLISHAHAYRHASPVFPGSIGPDDVNLVALPLFHLAGTWALVYNAFTVGASSVIVGKFSASRFWDQVREYGATHTILLGVMAEFLYRQPARADDADHPMRLAYTMPVREWSADFERRFGLALYSCFGQTEAGQPIFAVPGTLVPGSCGVARPEYDVDLVDEHDRPVGAGTVGELVVRAHEPWTTMLGYDGRPDETLRVWRNLWLHTGDLFRRDEAGRFFFVDRARDAIRRRGENVSATEVEARIAEHPAVADVAVIGVASEYAEQEILAVVVRAGGDQLTPEDLTDFLADRLPRFMLPRYIEFRSELPRTPTAKVRKAELREQGITTSTWDRERSTSPR